jgi:hypothetical protein
MVQKEEEPEIITEKEKNDFFKKIMESERKRQKKGPPIPPLSMDDIKKAYAFPQHKSFFALLLSDDEGNVYALRIPSFIEMPPEAEFDFFSSEGYYLYRMKMSVLPRVIGNGFVYRDVWDSENEFFRVKRFKIKNWDQLKTDIN